MMQHLIIEGCDGSGKTSLIDELTARLYLARHARASDSLTGPVPALDRWVEIDLDHMEERSELEGLPPFIYDRNPLVSELIYADLRWRNQGLSGSFTDTSWLVETRRRMASQSILVICSPPYEEVERVMQAQGRDSHMPGVFENRFTIWKRYENLVWPGTTIRYDRTKDTVDDLINSFQALEK